MSLLNLLKKKSRVSLFTTPSHSQDFFILSKFRQFYKYDISETEAHDPQSALELAQIKAAKIYKTKSTHFLTNGSTSGIIAAVLSCTNRDEKVLIWDNAHPAHKNAVELAGAKHIYYELETDSEWGIYNSASPAKLEEILKKHNAQTSIENSREGAIKTVIITSPSYEGIVSDIRKIKEICAKYGAYLIVDEAHGALYPFCDELPESAIYQGADFVIQSLHKTAGGLNPTALLHCNLCHSEASAEESVNIKPALAKITTTSPSYPMLASIEKNITYLNSKKGRAKMSELVKNIQELKQNVKTCKFHPTNDTTKILVKAEKLRGEELSEFLFDNKIEDEKTNEVSTMLLCGIGTDSKKLHRLEKVLNKLK